MSINIIFAIIGVAALGGAIGLFFAVRFVVVRIRADILERRHQKEWDAKKEELRNAGASEVEILHAFTEYVESLVPDPILDYCSLSGLYALC